MAATVFVRARVDEDIKNQAAAVLADMGLTVSDLLRITLTKVAKDKTFPFDLSNESQRKQQAKIQLQAIAKQAHLDDVQSSITDAWDAMQ